MNVQRALIAQLIAKLSPAKVTLVEGVIKPWASVTFAGERHEFALLVEGEAANRVSKCLQRTITCEEFDLKGHLVADILINRVTADGETVRLDIEALTVVLD